MNGLNGSGWTLCAICGGPPPEGPIRSPFSSRIAIEVESEMPPDAFSTPSTAADLLEPATRGSAAPDSGRSKPLSKADFGCTVTSTPALASAKMSSKALSTDPFSMKVPATIATPSMIASAVSAARSFREASPRSARLEHRYEVPHQADDVVLALHLPVGGDLAVGEDDDAIGVGGHLRVVGDHDDGLAELVDRGAKQVEDAAARLRVEVAGRLVGEDDGGTGDQRPGDRDPLLLPARELGGPVGGAVGQADGLEQLIAPGRIGVVAGDPHRQLDVLGGVEDRHEVEELEDEAELLAAELGQPLVVRGGSPRRRRSRRWPAVGLSSPASRCISVDLPDPDGPTIAVSSPAGNSRLTPRRASTAASPSP